MLKELKLFGFKSFANKTKLIFPRPSGKCFGITAIVGPNGSGKSNLVETIQWILGEQKYKNLRSHTSQDLIFSGSHLRKPADFAEAALTLENKTNSDIWSEIQIKRRIWRNGESEYLLNNNKVRLSDIETALFKINFGKYNYSIINQSLHYNITIQDVGLHYINVSCIDGDDPKLKDWQRVTILVKPCFKKFKHGVLKRYDPVGKEYYWIYGNLMIDQCPEDTDTYQLYIENNITVTLLDLKILCFENNVFTRLKKLNNIIKEELLSKLNNVISQVVQKF